MGAARSMPLDAYTLRPTRRPLSDSPGDTIFQTKPANAPKTMIITFVEFINKKEISAAATKVINRRTYKKNNTRRLIRLLAYPASGVKLCLVQHNEACLIDGHANDCRASFISNYYRRPLITVAY